MQTVCQLFLSDGDMVHECDAPEVPVGAFVNGDNVFTYATAREDHATHRRILVYRLTNSETF